MDIRDLTFDELKETLVKLGEPAFRAGQVFAWLYQKGAGGFADITDIPKSLREKLAGRYSLYALELKEKLQSEDGTEKFLFRLTDGRLIESVLIPAGSRNTVCLSTQVGCKFGCLFCASGLGGFKRNLKPSEITGQILFLRDRLDYRLTNFVFMGMGEPLDNIDNVARAIRIMNSAEGLGIAARRIAVSTVGLVPGIEQLKGLDLQIHLSLSLHAVRNNLRSRLVPINKKYPLEKVVNACEDYVKNTRMKITLEYVLIRDVNDSAPDAAGLAAMAVRLKAKVNLIPYSPVPGLDYVRPLPGRALQFQEWLLARKVNAILRRSKGLDIRAACGQLAGGMQP